MYLKTCNRRNMEDEKSVESDCVDIGSVDNSSADLGSDVWYEFGCTTCEKDNRNVNAVKHCIECEENLCAQCVKQHSRFAAMKAHQMLDKCVYVKASKSPVPSLRCEKHSGKVIDIYCPVHDTACCSTCVALQHSNCVDMKYLPDAASGFKNSEEMRNFEINVTHALSQLSRKRKEMKEHVEDLRMKEKELLQQTEGFRNEINRHLDIMQSKINDKVKDELMCEINAANKSIEEVDDALSTLKDQETLINDIDKLNDLDLFVQMKIGKMSARRGLELLTKLKQIPTFRNTFCLNLDYNVEKTIGESDALAELTKESDASALRLLDEFSIKVPEDKEVPVVGGICEFSENEFIIADATNARIKKLDENFCVTSYIDLQAGPYSVCYIGHSTVAVTMVNAKVQFVLVKEPMARTISFSLGARCRGITCINKELYVCCGGQHAGEAGRVEVYDLHGTHIRSYFANCSMPMNLCTNKSYDKIYLADKRQGLIIMDRHFVLKSIVKTKKLENLFGVCMADGSSLYISDYQTNSIAFLTKDGKSVKNLLSSKDGIEKPMALCFVKRKNYLIVTMSKTDKVKVYSVVN